MDSRRSSPCRMSNTLLQTKLINVSEGKRIGKTSGGRIVRLRRSERRNQDWKSPRDGDSRSQSDRLRGFKAGIVRFRSTRIQRRLLRSVQSESVWAGCSQAAAARGGAREGRPRHSRIFRVVSGG